MRAAPNQSQTGDQSTFVVEHGFAEQFADLTIATWADPDDEPTYEPATVSGRQIEFEIYTDDEISVGCALDFEGGGDEGEKIHVVRGEDDETVRRLASEFEDF